MKKSSAIIGGLQTLALATSLISSGALAANSGSTTSAKAAEVAPTLKDKLSVTLVSALYGPAIAHITDSRQTDKNGNLKDPISSDHTLAGYYKVNSNIKAGLNFNFSYVPVRGQSLSLLPPALRVNHSNLFTLGKLKMGGAFRVYLPISSLMTENKIHTILRADEDLNYSVNSKLSAGLNLTQRANFYGAGNAVGAKQTRFAIVPNMGYQITDKVAASVAYEFYYTHRDNMQTAIGLTQEYPEDLLLGASIDLLNSKLNLAPYIKLYPEGNILKSASIGLDMVAVFL